MVANWRFDIGEIAVSPKKNNNLIWYIIFLEISCGIQIRKPFLKILKYKEVMAK